MYSPNSCSSWYSKHTQRCVQNRKRQPTLAPREGARILWGVEEKLQRVSHGAEVNVLATATVALPKQELPVLPVLHNATHGHS